MASKKPATIDTEPPIETIDPIWNPAGHDVQPPAEPHDAHVLDWRAQQTPAASSADPQFEEFLQVLRDAKDDDSQLIIVTEGTTT